ncbi:hypothetical protein [Nonomuraea sp. NPDC003201]
MASRYGRQGRYAARCGDGYCADKANPGTSKIEAELFAPLNYVIGNGRRNQVVEASNKSCRFDVDMTFELKNGWLLIVEYDGAYWHEGRELGDHNKSHMLAGGYRHKVMVVRVREHPLTRLCPMDVWVPKGSDGTLCARLAVLHMLHAMPVDAWDFGLMQRAESWLLCAADALVEDQVECRICWRMEQILREPDIRVGSGEAAYRAETESPPEDLEAMHSCARY